MISDPIFIIGTERSGSNLLRLLLNAHPSVLVPHPPHVMRDFAPFLDRYGDLGNEENFRRLIDDVASSVELHFAPWPFKPDRERLFHDTSNRSLYGIFAGLYEQHLAREGKRRWGCKSTFMYRHIEEILAHHAEPRFLHLVRDPRDVAVSAERSVFSAFHPLKAAELWTAEQGVIEASAARLRPGLLLRVRYEDLTRDPETKMKEVMGFLGEEFKPEQLSFFKKSEAREISALSASWKKCGEPVSTTSVGRFKKILAPNEVAQVESVAKTFMDQYGYPLAATGPAPKVTSLDRLEIEFSERVRWLRTEIRALFEDRNAVLRLRKRLFIRAVKLKQVFVRGRTDGAKAGR